MTSIAETEKQIQLCLKENGFSIAGQAPLQKPVTWSQYESWIQKGHHGEMHYLKDQMPARANPVLQNPDFQSAWVVAVPYLPHPKPQALFKRARVALYAQGEDYHHWLMEKLNAVARELEQKIPGAKFRSVTDSFPLLERDLAVQAGLGWFGKNTCLLTRTDGSLLLLGELLCSLPMGKPAMPSPDFCGTCNRCLEICPTKALVAPRELDARLCISYWTIESRELPPIEIRDQMGDWLFGCDLCQTICPWNQRSLKILPLADRNQETLPLDVLARQELVEDLRFLLESSGKTIEKHILGTPLRRAGPFGLRRNALLIVARLGLQELRSCVASWAVCGSHESASRKQLAELANWVLQKWSNASS